MVRTFYRYAVLLVALTACGKSAKTPVNPSPTLPSSVSFGRVDTSVSLDANAQILAQDYDSSSTALYKALAGTGDTILFSAYSIDTAMGMMYAGAEGSTVADIAKALQWHLDPNALPPAHQTLTTVIATAAANGNTTLQTGTRLWTDTSVNVLPSYNATLQDYYGATAQSVNFGNPTSASQLIDAWVADQTADLIPNLLAPNDVAGASLVQTAALHFKASWSQTFTADSSASATFTNMQGQAQPVAMLRQAAYYPYAETATYQAIDIPYKGNMALMVVLPKGNLSDFEAALTGPFVHTVAASLQSTYVQLAIPPLQLDAKPDLTQALRTMGMQVAFSDDANFSGTGISNLLIQAVIGEAVLKLDALGTEAAAATGVVAIAGDTLQPPSNPIVFTADHPFFFAIHDTQTNVPLFSGRVGSL